MTQHTAEISLDELKGLGLTNDKIDEMRGGEARGILKSLKHRYPNLPSLKKADDVGIDNYNDEIAREVLKDVVGIVNRLDEPVHSSGATV